MNSIIDLSEQDWRERQLQTKTQTWNKVYTNTRAQFTTASWYDTEDRLFNPIWDQVYWQIRGVSSRDE